MPQAIRVSCRSPTRRAASAKPPQRSNLGTALAAIGERVLIVDLDPQGNASTGLGIDRRSRNCSTYDVLIGEALRREAVVATASAAASPSPPRPWTCPASSSNWGTTAGRAFRLRECDRPGAESKCRGGVPDYTYVLIDCPPSLNLLTVNAMAASDAILVPLQCEFFALEGLSQLLADGGSRVRVERSMPNLVDPWHRADHVELAQQPVEPGRRRRPPVHGLEGLQHHDPAQRPHLRGAVLRQAGLGLRSQMRRQRCVSEARDRE